ncbi:MAG: MBL fold metallo-hydrolase [Candidatus Polarisedimenticolia bacterium]
MKLIQMEVGAMQNFNYVLGCGRTGQAAWIDPAWEVPRVLEAARDAGLQVTRLLITHTHPDHIEGLSEARRLTGAAVHVHALEAGVARGRLSDPAGVEAVSDDDLLEVGDLRIRAMHTPGHTPGATCYLAEGEADGPGAVFTGDTLFIGRCGRTDFAGSDPEAMHRSLRRLAALPPDTLVYPGHNYADRPVSTIERESRENVHMSAPDLREFLRRRMGEAWVAARYPS